MMLIIQTVAEVFLYFVVSVIAGLAIGYVICTLIEKWEERAEEEKEEFERKLRVQRVKRHIRARYWR